MTRSRPATPKIPPDSPALRQLRARGARWVAWRYSRRDDGKIAKPPVDPRTGLAANHSDPRTWATFEEAAWRAKNDGLAGVGFVLAPGDGVVGADLDDVRDPATGEIETWAQEIVDLRETYCEVSPSGAGLRLLWLGALERSFVKNGAEVYASGRYLTITGDRLASSPDSVMPAPRTLEALRRRAGVAAEPPRSAGAPEFFDPADAGRGVSTRDAGLPEPLGAPSLEEVEAALDAIDPDADYRDWIAVAAALNDEMGEAGFALWNGWSRGGKKYPRRGERVLRSHWRSLREGGGVTIATLFFLAAQADPRWRDWVRPAPTELTIESVPTGATFTRARAR